MLAKFNLSVFAIIMFFTYKTVKACNNLDLTQVPGQCHKFYRCSNSLYLYRMSCPPGLLFDQNLRVCNYPNQVNCIQETNQFKCDSTMEGGLFQVSNDCSKYYKCTSSFISIFTCPSGFLFDQTLKKCNFASQVPCSTVINSSPSYYPYIHHYTSYTTRPTTIRTTTTTTTTPYRPTSEFSFFYNNPLTTSFNFFGCDPALELTPVVGDCSRYYKCLNNRMYVMTCPNEMVFDSFSQQCQRLSPTNCISSSNIQNIVKCDSSRDIDQIPDPNDCAKFKKCINNYMLTFTCPPNYLFDHLSGLCQEASLVTCISSSSPIFLKSDTNRENYNKNYNINNRCDMDKHLTPLENDCSKYYKCLDDSLYIYSCPYGYLWDNTIKKCNVDSLVSNITCSSLLFQYITLSTSANNLINKNILSTESTRKTTNLSDAINCAARHLSKIDCFSYYFCVIENGNKKVKLEIRTCTNNRVFDEETGDCQDKIYVKEPCGNSPS